MALVPASATPRRAGGGTFRVPRRRGQSGSHGADRDTRATRRAARARAARGASGPGGLTTAGRGAVASARASGGQDAPVPTPFAPEDGLAAWLLANMRSIEGRHVLMVIAPADFRDEELLEPKAFFEAEGAVVEIASTTAGLARGMQGADVKPGSHRRGGVVHTAIPPSSWSGSRSSNVPVGERRLARPPARRPCRWHSRSPPSACRARCWRAQVSCVALRATVFGLPRAKHELLRGGAIYVEDDVVVDSGAMTAAGPHAAREFTRAVVREMAGEHQWAPRSRSHPAPRR